MAGVFSYGTEGVIGCGSRPGLIASEAMTATDRTPIDRDEPCPCGCLAGWPLDDGATECPRCGRVEQDRWQVAHE